MAVTFQPITLDSGTEDRDAVLMLRDGRLAAVLTCLSGMHGPLAGRWFVEAEFAALELPRDRMVEDLGAAEGLLPGASGEP